MTCEISITVNHTLRTTQLSIYLFNTRQIVKGGEAAIQHMLFMGDIAAVLNLLGHLLQALERK